MHPNSVLLRPEHLMLHRQKRCKLFSKMDLNMLNDDCQKNDTIIIEVTL